MNNNLIDRFKDCNTLTDVYAVARALRAEEGISNQEVNALVTAAKKMIISRSTDYNRIEKYAIPAVSHNDVPISQFALSIVHINEPVVTIKADGTIEL